MAELPTGWTAELEAARIKLCEWLVEDAAARSEANPKSGTAAKLRDAEMALTLLASLVWPPKGERGNAWPLYAGETLIGYVYPDEANAAAIDGATLTVGTLPVKDREPGRPDGWAKVDKETWKDHDGSRSPPAELLGTTALADVEYTNGHSRFGIAPNMVAWRDVKRWRVAR